MSKRKLTVLVKNQVVCGWDDPRLFTLSGLKRRGVTPQAINEFIDRVGFARRGNENFISYELLEFCVRKHLNEIAPRTLAVLEPLKIVLLNLDNDFQVKAPLFPGEKAKGNYLASVSRELYIEKADFKQERQDGFLGLCPGQIVGLKYLPFHISFIAETEEGVLCEVTHPTTKPRSSLHWISPKDSFPCETRLYSLLFHSERASEQADWLSDINPHSLTIHSNSLVHRHILNTETPYQFERLGYFTKDPDSTPARPVFNRVCPLKSNK